MSLNVPWKGHIVKMWESFNGEEDNGQSCWKSDAWRPERIRPSYTYICRLANTFAPYLDKEALKSNFEDCTHTASWVYSNLKDKGQKGNFCSYWMDIINQRTSTGGILEGNYPTVVYLVSQQCRLWEIFMFDEKLYRL